MSNAAGQPELANRVAIHDQKQFEIKLEYQPAPGDKKSRYLIEKFMFLPASLNVDADTYPRQQFYADIHNYVRLKTPIFRLDEILIAELSPLVQLEKQLEPSRRHPESDIVYQAKMLSCVFRGALRRFTGAIAPLCDELATHSSNATLQRQLTRDVQDAMSSVSDILERYRAFMQALSAAGQLEAKTSAALRLVDEYMSLSVEQIIRRDVADMSRRSRAELYLEIRKAMMAKVIQEETYRKENSLRSVISATGDNEEYMRRLGFLKKYCMNILFLVVRREPAQQTIEEVLFAVSAGVAMAFATAVAIWAQARFPQAGLNLFLIIVVGYMMKDRIKEGLRRILAIRAQRYLYDRTTYITDPVTKRRLGECREKVDYGAKAPAEIYKLRKSDDFITASEGELSESVIHYQKQIVLASEHLPRVAVGITGVTDIIRFNVDRLLRDMDDPEYALQYVDLEDFSVGHVRAAKSYQVDLAFRFTVDRGRQRQVSYQLIRFVLDRNGIKRMHQSYPDATSPDAAVARSVA
jgi:hypothetical protein